MNKRAIKFGIAVPIAIVIPTIIYLIYNSPIALAAPSINKDPSLKVETLVNGLDTPTSMAFVDNNNILVLEKAGQVRLVSNGMLQDKPVLQVPVDTESERGLLGIAIMNSTKTSSTMINNNNILSSIWRYFHISFVIKKGYSHSRIMYLKSALCVM